MVRRVDSKGWFFIVLEAEKWVLRGRVEEVNFKDRPYIA